MLLLLVLFYLVYFFNKKKFFFNFKISVVSLMNAPNFLTYKITEQTLGETCGDLAVLKYKNHTAYIPGVADIALKVRKNF